MQPFLTLRSAALAAALSLTAASALAQVRVYEFQPGQIGSARTGEAVARAGDVDKDGVEDLIVASPGATLALQTLGAVHVYSGRTGALLHSKFGSNAGDRFGEAVAPGGDLDNDGWDDFLVGIPGHDQGRGRVVGYSGKTGLPILTKNGNAAGDNFGAAIALVGRADGDLRDDFAISAPFELNGGPVSGVVRLYSGATKAQLASFGVPFFYNASVGFGLELAGGFDFDGDARDDFAVGAPFYDDSGTPGLWEGLVLVYSGATGGTLGVVLGEHAGDRLGWALCGLADVDGNGKDELAIGAPWADQGGSDAGRVALWGQGASAPLRTLDGVAGSHFGYALAGLDADGDSLGDLAVGAPDRAYGLLGTVLGNVSIFRGSNSALLDVVPGTDGGGGFGYALAALRDLNGDDVEDLLVGEPALDEPATNSGRARAFLVDAVKPASFCQSKQNSLGCWPSISASGAPSLSIADNFRVRAGSVLNKTPGLLAYGFAQASTPFAGGTLCLGAPIVRTAGQNSGGAASGTDCSGSFEFHFSQAWFASKGYSVGTQLHCQYWSRDNGFAAPNNVSLTQGLSFTLLP